MKATVIAVIGICILFALANPDMDEFACWGCDCIEQTDDLQHVQGLESLSGPEILCLSTLRHDFSVCSVYIVDCIVQKKVIVLGILNRFIRLN